MLDDLLLALCVGGWVILLLRETGHLGVRRGAGVDYARRLAQGDSDGPFGGPGPGDNRPGPGVPPQPSSASMRRG